MADCNICCEKLNKSNRKEIICVFCNFSTCRACFQKYILDTIEDPNCMNCKKIFNRTFINENCTIIFINTIFKKHRQDVLFNREKAMLLETQPYVELEIRRNNIHKEIELIRTEKFKLENAIQKLNLQMNRLYSNISALNINNIFEINGSSSSDEEQRKKFIRKCPMEDCRGFLSTRWKCGSCETQICKDCNEEQITDHICKPENVASMELLNKDTKSCPECGTMIYKIAGCFAKDTPILRWNATVVFSQNIVVGDKLVGDNGTVRNVLSITNGIDELFKIEQSNGITYTVNSKHTLLLKDYQNKIFEITAENYHNYNNLLGFKGVGKGESIINITPIGKGEYYGFLLDDNHNFLLSDFTACQNCSHMFCTECKCSWDWNTHSILKGTNTNPHYYEFIRNNGNVKRNLNDIPCGGMPDVYTIRNIFQRFSKIDIKTINTLYALHNCITHIERIEITHAPVIDVVVINRPLRVTYLMNNLTEDLFKQTLQIREKVRDKHTDFNNIYQMFVNVASDIFTQIYQFVRNKTSYGIEETEFINTNYTILINLTIYFNENVKKIGKMYNCVYPGFTDTCTWVNNLETYTKNKIKK